MRTSWGGLLIVGAGLAGLSAALAAAPRKALVVTGASLGEGCASGWAQGGIAAALGADDAPELHAEDTEHAGAGLVDRAAARLLADEGPAAVRWLADLGAPFDRAADGSFVQGLEAAHSRSRVAKVKGDQAGREIMLAAVAAARAADHVRFEENARLRALLQDANGRVVGGLFERDGRFIEITADAVILATGGLGGLYAVTTNPSQARGEGLGLAALAGARIADPEFVQFHPTAIDIGRDPAPLATEALRGEGAVLVDATTGEPFMRRYHALGDLAPRDVVARAVHRQRLSGAGAFLDAREAVGDHFPDQFPAVFAACMSVGIDPRAQPIPVAPAAHYHMGGIATDLAGRTSLPGLWAVGECASTGVHGANRLASNSLLEAVVFGRRAGTDAAEHAQSGGNPLPAEPAPELPAGGLQRLRAAMTRDAGVLRDRAGLQRLLGEIDALADTHGDCASLVAARLVTACALARMESRGGHYRDDFPVVASPARRTFVRWAEIEPNVGLRFAAE